MIRSPQNVVIIGAGQGGLSTSYYLTRAGIGHIVVDKSGIAHAWRNERWDSFCLVIPNWSIRLPGAEYAGDKPDDFMARDEFVAYMERWAASFDVPVAAGIEVFSIAGTPGNFALETSQGMITAKVVVVATATLQKPRIPAIARDIPDDVMQLISTEYKNPRQLPAGAVLIVGSGQTGCQVAEELREAGREVYLCVGRAGRLPRRYRGRDCIAWQRDMGLLDRTPDRLDSPAQRFAGDPHVSGRAGGHTISLHDFYARGIQLLGRLEGVSGRSFVLADDLARNMAFADDYANGFMQKIDDYIEQSGLAAPAPSETELSGGPPAQGWRPALRRTLAIDAANIRTLIWATGFDYDFSWIDFPVHDAMGYPQTEQGVSAVPGLYFMGLNWMHKRKSGILYGVGEDAAHVAAHIEAYTPR